MATFSKSPILPIEIVSRDSKRNVFHWKQTIETIVGKQIVNHVGSVPSSLEASLIELIKFTKQQEQELVGLRRQVEQLEDKVKTQNEQLSKKIESDQRQTVQTSMGPLPATKKNK